MNEFTNSSVSAFISYSHDSEAHQKRVRALADRLRKEGINCSIDQYEQSPEGGWPRWMMRQIEGADYILVVCSESYSRFVLDGSDGSRGHGSAWEGTLITQTIYEAQRSKKVAPILLTKNDAKYRPAFLRHLHYFCVDTDDGYDELYRYLTNQPRIQPPPVGSILPRPPQQLDEGIRVHGGNEKEAGSSAIPGDIITEGFSLLTRARSFSGKRDILLARLEKLVAEHQRAVPDRLFRALKEFAAYEKDRGRETYRLQHGVKLLEESLSRDTAPEHPVDRYNLQLLLIQQAIYLFLSGDNIPDGRRRYLELAVSRGQHLAQSIDDEHPIQRAHCAMALGEAYKEMAMIEADADKHKTLIEKARRSCESAINIVKSLTSEEAKYLLGCAFRHLAVTYELEADMMGRNTSRRDLYQQWQRLSMEAVGILEEIGETTVRAYAMMNAASGHIRLADPELIGHKKSERWKIARSMLEDSIKLLRSVQDFRGIGWVFVHLCEMGVKQQDEMGESADLSLEQLEEWANGAISALRHVEDILALGLAYEHLGIVLYSIVRATGEDDVRLDRAIRALEEGIKCLERSGYFRATGEASLWRAQCYLYEWKRHSGWKPLAAAIQELARGINTTAGSGSDTTVLEKVCAALDQRLRDMLYS